MSDVRVVICPKCGALLWRYPDGRETCSGCEYDQPRNMPRIPETKKEAAMPDDMVERVARAIMTRTDKDKDNWKLFEFEARAAIEAMREPTEEMLDAGMTHCGLDLASEYRAMIDAALQTKKAGDRA